MSEAERMADLIKQRLPEIEPGTLRFWGEWFGRPYDNKHKLIGCDAEVELLRLHFNEGEVLSVWSPRDLRLRLSGSRSTNWGRGAGALGVVLLWSPQNWSQSLL
jgi:hypothetical protein